MNTQKLCNNEKKIVAMGSKRDAALSVILPRLMGAILKSGHLGKDSDGNPGLFAVTAHFDIWCRSDRHYVYLWVRYLRRKSVFSCRLYSDGSGNALDRRVKIVCWDRSVCCREWQSAIFDQFDYDALWLLDVPQEIFIPNVVRTLNDYIQMHPQRHVQ